MIDEKTPEELEAERSRLLELIILGTDLKNMSDESRVLYYKSVCETVGLNPLTKPLDFLVLDGKSVLYAKKDCTDQLRRSYKVSVNIIGREELGDVYTVTARATMPSGRTDESIGAVSRVYPQRVRGFDGKMKEHPKAGKPLEGLDLANALMRCETKAKRRVTLSIVGFGILDESEIEDIQQVESPVVTTVEMPVAKEPEEAPKCAPSLNAGTRSTETVEGESVKNAPLPSAETGALGSANGASPVAAKTEPAMVVADLLPANRLKTFRAKMTQKGITEEDVQQKFGASLEKLPKSKSAEIDAFLNGKTK